MCGPGGPGRATSRRGPPTDEASSHHREPPARGCVPAARQGGPDAGLAPRKRQPDDRSSPVSPLPGLHVLQPPHIFHSVGAPIFWSPTRVRKAPIRDGGHPSPYQRIRTLFATPGRWVTCHPSAHRLRSMDSLAPGFAFHRVQTVSAATLRGAATYRITPRRARRPRPTDCAKRPTPGRWPESPPSAAIEEVASGPSVRRCFRTLFGDFGILLVESRPTAPTHLSAPGYPLRRRLKRSRACSPPPPATRCPPLWMARSPPSRMGSSSPARRCSPRRWRWPMRNCRTGYDGTGAGRVR